MKQWQRWANATKANALQINIKEFIREITTDILSLNVAL